MDDEREFLGRVLIVEDDPPTSRLLSRAIQEAYPQLTCDQVETAEAALSLLMRPAYPPDEPQLVLLDLDLPNKDGFEVLEALRSHAELRRTPVVVISGDSSTSTVNRCYELHARSFIEKPNEWDEFVAIGESIGNYWFETAQLPGSSRKPSKLGGNEIEIE